MGAHTFKPGEAVTFTDRLTGEDKPTPRPATVVRVIKHHSKSTLDAVVVTFGGATELAAFPHELTIREAP